MTTSIRVDEATYQLRTAIAVEGARLGSMRPWLWEVDRWKELVFALLTRAAGIPEQRVREITDRLFDLGLLDVGELAALYSDRDVPLARRIGDLMTSMGVGHDEAQIALTTIIDAARGLNQHYGGKVQRYLRRYGELMLRETGESFNFTALKPEAVADAFTYWLQNVVSMPLSLTDESVRAFCERYGFTVLDLRDAADEIDVNLSLVDDVIQLHMARHASGIAAGESDASP